MRVVRPLLLALLGVVVLTGAAARAAAPDTTGMVLGPLDLPAGFEVDMSNGRPVPNSTATPSDVALGRLGGSETTLSASPTHGLDEIVSQASAYRSARGASVSTRRAWAVMEREQRLGGRRVRYRRVSLGRPLGSEARMHHARASLDGKRLDFYTVIWRYRNVVAVVLRVAPRGTVSVGEVTRLAARQQTKIVAALG